MRRLAGIAGVLLAAAACSGAEPGPGTIALADSYDATGVVRFYRDGVALERLETVHLSFDRVSVDGAVASGEVARRGAAAVAVTGEYDEATGVLHFSTPFEAALTSTSAETVEQLGGGAIEALPRDGVGDELNGFIRVRRGSDVLDGQLVAISRIPGRPDRPGEAITARLEEVGRARVRGEPGTTLPKLGIELLVYTLGKKDPGFFILQADDAGGFEGVVDGLAEDVVLIRARAGGVASDARAVTVTR